MERVDLMQAIIDYGDLTEAQGRAFMDPNTTAEEHKAICDQCSEKFRNIMTMLDKFEVRPF